jgi:hypothetical protein
VPFSAFPSFQAVWEYELVARFAERCSIPHLIPLAGGKEKKRKKKTRRG